MSKRFRFNRMEAAGSFGDLGTLLPIAIAMILVNGMSGLGIFLSIGLYYVLAGVWFGVTVPVQPMKVIGAYAIAASLSPGQIAASGLLMAVLLTAAALTGAIELVRKYTPQAAIRGVQLSTGSLLIAGGVKFMLGASKFQELQGAAEPYLSLQQIGPIPIGLILGVIAAVITLLLLDNKRFPAGVAVVALGIALGLLLGAGRAFTDFNLGLHLPHIMPFGFPGEADFTFALLALVLPQLPMTLGNAALAYTDLSHSYFGEDSAKVTNKNACLSMAAANVLSFLLGGMPLCHGAGGLAAHYRFGARTAGSNLIIGGAFIILALLLGSQVTSVLSLLPMAVLGVLLVFAGAQLAMTVLDVKNRKDLFVVLIILGVTLASNLAAGFVTGICAAWLLKWDKLSV